MTTINMYSYIKNENTTEFVVEKDETTRNMTKGKRRAKIRKRKSTRRNEQKKKGRNQKSEGKMME